MNEHYATEIAFKNGYKKAKDDIERLQAQNSDLEVLVKDLKFRIKEFVKCNDALEKVCADKDIEIDEAIHARSRVAEEIFEEIDEICNDYNRYEIGERGLFAKLAELKKKYTGETS